MIAIDDFKLSISRSGTNALENAFAEVRITNYEMERMRACAQICGAIVESGLRSIADQWLEKFI